MTLAPVSSTRLLLTDDLDFVPIQSLLTFPVVVSSTIHMSSVDLLDCRTTGGATFALFRALQSSASRPVVSLTLKAFPHFAHGSDSELESSSDFNAKLANMWDIYDTLTNLKVTEAEPYKYYYKGRELLDAATAAANRLINESMGEREELEWHLMAIELAMGRNLYWCEEVHEAETRFMAALKLGLLAPKRQEKRYTFAIIDCLQQLANIWLERGDWTRAINFLLRSAYIYVAAEKKFENDQWESSDIVNLEKLKTLTIYGLARAYGGLGMVTSASRACSLTLSRQLEHNMDASDDAAKDAPFDYREWARNAVSLADYYIGRGEFWTAEYLMHAARILSMEWPEKIGEKRSDEFVAEIWRDVGRFYRTRLEISKFHEKRKADECLALWRCNAEVKEKREVAENDLGLSWECLADDHLESRRVRWHSEEGFPENVSTNDGFLLLDEKSAVAERVVEDGEPTDDDGMLRIHLSGEIVVQPAICFPTIHGSIERAMQVHNRAFIEACGVVMDHRKHLTYCAKDFATARELFKVGQYFDQQALSVFVLDGYASDHVQTVQELARLHEALEFWEVDPSRVRALLKRRVKLLEPVLKEINPMVYVQFNRQLSFEIAEICRQLAEGLLGPEGQYEVGPSNRMTEPGEVAQLRRYIIKSVNSFARFIRSFEAPANQGTSAGQSVEVRLDDSVVQHVISAREQAARLLSKDPSPNASDRLESLVTALSHYEWVKAYAKHHKQQISEMPEANQEAIRLTSEMAELLPMHIARLKASTVSAA
ncbi:hypothetical protein FOZ63_024229 [Perkinsus olseni]|uniref:KIF-binding protein n=1 Tax=Perkinsus olseni TaxID=32597 RepID=A0A7J6RSS5_PEROL|nr:hypothetical protein FOZ63_024229 [Perkinsus olseni]